MSLSPGRSRSSENGCEEDLSAATADRTALRQTPDDEGDREQARGRRHHRRNGEVGALWIVAREHTADRQAKHEPDANRCAHQTQ